MRILVEYPPLYETITRAFPAAKGAGVIFAWGDIIYNPSDILVSRELIAHEEIHSAQQANYETIMLWWHLYLETATFRYAQELPAHQAEYRAYCNRHPNSRKRAEYLNEVSAKLASPLYGSLMTVDAARRAIAV